MHKTLMMACMAIAAFAALVVAPAASATNLTEGGVTIKPGASITAINIGNTLFEAGELTTTCTGAHMVATVTRDDSGMIEGTIAAGTPSFTGTGTGGDCTSPLGSVKRTLTSELCLKVNNSDNGVFTGCAGANVTFTLNVTNIVTCTYQKAEMPVTITTVVTGDARISLNKAGVIRDTGNAFFCPAAATFTMTFELKTTNGTTLAFSA